MPALQIIEPHSEEEFAKYYKLRWEVLRAPWQQPRGSEKAEDDATAQHLLLVNKIGEALGVCRLHLQTAEEAQIRFMAVHPEHNGKGYGKKLIQYAEEKARELGASSIILQARENAVPFYLSCGYQLLERTHLLFGTIQHYKMHKDL